MRTLVFVDGCHDGRICICSTEFGYTVQSIFEIYDLSSTFQYEAEIFAVIRAIETIPSGDYYILSDSLVLVNGINSDNISRAKWVRYKIQRIKRLLKRREKEISVKFIWIPRELNRAGLILDGINPDIEHYLGVENCDKSQTPKFFK